MGPVSVSCALTGNGNYTTLRAAFAALNGSVQTNANIFISVTADTNEGVQPAVLNHNSWASVRITPVGARRISGNPTGGSSLIALSGADNVTIDGLNSGGNSLHISNTTVSAAGATGTIRIFNDAVQNTIRNCTITGAGSANSSVIILFGAGITTGNDNNTVANCIIRDATEGLSANGIASLVGTSDTFNGNNVIRDNLISNFFAAAGSNGVFLGQNNAGWTITGNRFFPDGRACPWRK